MENLDLLIDLHQFNHRQGPGGDPQTEQAFQLTGLDPAAPLASRSGRDLEGRAILSLVGRGPTVQRVPVSPPDTNTAVLTGKCRIGENGSVTGVFRLDLSGNRNPYHRLTQPKDVADAIVAFSRPELAWMTGNIIRVDGGECIAP